MNPRHYAKALVPVIVAIILPAIAFLGLTPEMSIKEGLTLLVTAGLVYLVPNKA